MTNQFQPKDAKSHLEQAGLYVHWTEKSYSEIRGGAKTVIDPDGTKIVIDPFRIILEGQSWLALLRGPYQDITVIHTSKQLKEVVMAVEAFFNLYESQEIRYTEFVETLATLQYRGIVTLIDSSIKTPTIIAFCTEELKVDKRYEFMLQNAPLAERSKTYRIYPYQSQWAIDSPNSNDSSSLKIVSDIDQATAFLIDLCSRAK